MLSRVRLFGRLCVLLGAIGLVTVACIVPPMTTAARATVAATHTGTPHPARPGAGPGPCLQSTQCGGSGALLLSGGTFGSPLLAAPLLVASTAALALLVGRFRRRRQDPLPSGVHQRVLRPPRALSVVV
jgi:hypothetical protein